MYEVTRNNSTITVDGKPVEGKFPSERTKEIEALLAAGYIKEVKDVKTTNK